MKRFSLVLGAIGVIALGRMAMGEPVFVPQAASVVKKGQVEVGSSGQFGFQKFELAGSPGTTFKDRVWHVMVVTRYGVMDTVETHLLVPLTVAVDSSEGGASSRDANTGIGNVQMGAKWNFLPGSMPVAAGVNFDLPTARSSKNPAPLGWRYSGQIQQGFNSHVYLAADTPEMGELVKGHASAGYMYTAEYTNANDAKFNPSDLVTFGAALNLNLNRWIEHLALTGELVGNSGINSSKTAGADNGASKGTILEAGPGVRYQVGSLRTHAGVLFDKGDSDFRAYNYRVLFGFSYLIGA